MNDKKEQPAELGPEGLHFVAPTESPTAEPQQVAAWTEVEAGRYMPRRVRGSCVGRALG